MAAVDVIITLAIIIKIIDIFVTRHKTTINEDHEKAKTTSSNKVPAIVAIIIILIGIAITNQKETNLKPMQRMNTNNQNPEGIYMQPLLSTTTGIINNMGKGMIENATRIQQEAQRKTSKGKHQ